MRTLNCNSQNTFPSVGNVGIGTTSPTEKLQVFGNISVIGDLQMNRMFDIGNRHINANTEQNVLSILANSSSVNGPYLELYGINHPIPDRRGNIKFISHGSTGEGIGFYNYDPSLATWKKTMSITNDQIVEVSGDLIIKGNNATTVGDNEIKLTSDGLIIARQIDVHLDPIPDYVFHAAFDIDSATHYENIGLYKPMSLKELEKFVQANRHLPGIKSAAGYQQTGSVNVGELQIKLLQKVEELTLYNIQLMKEIDELRRKQTELEAKTITPKN